MLIRKGTAADFPQVAEIYRMVHNLHRENRPDIYKATDALELMVWEFNENARDFYAHIGMRTKSRVMEKKLGEA